MNFIKQNDQIYKYESMKMIFGKLGNIFSKNYEHQEKADIFNLDGLPNEAEGKTRAEEITNMVKCLKCGANVGKKENVRHNKSKSQCSFIEKPSRLLSQTKKKAKQPEDMDEMIKTNTLYPEVNDSQGEIVVRTFDQDFQELNLSPFKDNDFHERFLY